MPFNTDSHYAVAKARSSGDVVMLAITFVVLFLMTSMYFVISSIMDLGPSASANPIEVFGAIGSGLMAGALLFVLILIGGMIAVRVQRQIMLGNCLEVKYSDYAWLREWSNQVASDFNMPRTEIFITQDPYINAYAYGFARPYNIVLHSGTIRYMSDDELKVVVAHEMGHIRYKHTNAMVYLMPFLSLPLVGIVGQYIIGFWKRRTELTCDRLALMYFRDAEIVKRALIKTHVGPDAEKYMNDIARQWQRITADGPFNRFVETLSTHPFLVRRLIHLDRYEAKARAVAPVVAENAV